MSDDKLYLHKNNTGLVQCFVAVILLVHVSKIKDVVGRFKHSSSPQSEFGLFVVVPNVVVVVFFCKC